MIYFATKNQIVKGMFNIKKLFLLFLCLTTLGAKAQAQRSNETSQPLSKKATKGMLVDAQLAEDGIIKLTYKMKVDKKSDEVAYEDYVFDGALSFKGIQPSTENKKKNGKETTRNSLIDL